MHGNKLQGVIINKDKKEDKKEPVSKEPTSAVSKRSSIGGGIVPSRISNISRGSSGIKNYQADKPSDNRRTTMANAPNKHGLIPNKEP